MSNLTDEQKMALQLTADCGWGVTGTSHGSQFISVVEVPAHEGERRELIDAVFGLPLGGEGTHLPTGQSIEELGLAFEEIPTGRYRVLVTRESDSEYGFDDETGDMGPLEDGEDVFVQRPLSLDAAMRGIDPGFRFTSTNVVEDHDVL